MYSKAMILQLWYRFLDLDSSHRCWLLAAGSSRLPTAVASAAVLAQRGLRGVAHARGESSARIKGATDTRLTRNAFPAIPTSPAVAAKVAATCRWHSKLAIGSGLRGC